MAASGKAPGQEPERAVRVTAKADAKPYVLPLFPGAAVRWLRVFTHPLAAAGGRSQTGAEKQACSLLAPAAEGLRVGWWDLLSSASCDFSGTGTLGYSSFQRVNATLGKASSVRTVAFLASNGSVYG